MELSPGTMVTRNVRLQRRLGEGAMGSVWVAEHLTLKLDVAVKFISAKLATDDPEVLARFEQEASTAARIKSDHVVQTHDCGLMEDGTPYIVMELLEGEGLRERLARDGTLSLHELGRVVGQTAIAVNRAHKEGIVHRDIKPDNLFLCRRDDRLHVKVLDFGVAQPSRPPDEQDHAVAADADSQAGDDGGVLVGTLQYLSPEQFKGEGEVDLHADLWALAVVAYRCVTGRFPFNGATPGLLCVSVLTGEFTRPTALCEGLPPEIDQWFARAFHADPTQRFDSARDMGLALARLIPASTEDLEDEIMSTGRFRLPGARDSAQSHPGAVEGELSSVLTPAGLTAAHQGMSRRAKGGIAALVVLAVVIAVVMLTRGDGPAQEAAGEEPRTGPTASARQAAAAAATTTVSDPSTETGGDADLGGAPTTEGSPPDDGEATPTTVKTALPTRSKPPTRYRPPRTAPTKEDYGF
ncbi:MAG: serine/threonine protein kinase [Deltaproteobacteria bacterium]|nr:serine/threonine protein kinase [Deltaproteobacteria bacterium]